MTVTAATLQTLAHEYQTILQVEQITKQSQLDSYRNALTELSRQYAQAQSIPPKPLTIPAIFGRSHHENFISDYLAFILDPTKNGIGTAPLAQFLELCGLDPDVVSLNEVTIHREYIVGSGRIDLLLEWEETQVVGIENKIYAVEGEGQTKYYACEIPRLFEDTPCHFVYLTRDGHKADSRKFRPISYADLLSALRQVVVAPNTGARQLVLWYDFLEHLEVYIIMSDPDHFEFSDKAKLYLKHLDMLRDLRTTFKNEWSMVIDYLEKQVYVHLDGGPWQTNFNRTREWHQVTKPTWIASQLLVSYYYYFSAAYFNRQEVCFVLDVERNRVKHFLDQFDQRYPALEAEYQQREMLYRPPSQRHVIAWKTYPISQDINQIAQTFVEAFDEFRFLEKEIDYVLAEWGQQ
jgi:hypothetical protein